MLKVFLISSGVLPVTIMQLLGNKRLWGWECETGNVRLELKCEIKTTELATGTAELQNCKCGTANADMIAIFTFDHVCYCQAG